MHWIQKHILRELILSGKARFSKLKPPSVDSNLFLYHLRQLIKELFVEKDGDHYILSQEGQRFANFYSFETDSIRLQPKILVAVVCYQEGQVLVHRRKREPFINKISLINGKLHFGEQLKTAAGRELEEKTGLKASELKHAGDAYLIYRDGKDIQNHVLSHNFICTKWRGTIKDTAHTEPMWVRPAELDGPDVLPGTVEILKAIDETENYFFKEFISKFTDT